MPKPTFSLSVKSRSDGTLEAAYVKVSPERVAKTKELVESVLLADFDADGALVGIEILAPVPISQVMKLAQNMEQAQRPAFRKFVKSSAPRELVTS